MLSCFPLPTGSSPRRFIFLHTWLMFKLHLFGGVEVEMKDVCFANLRNPPEDSKSKMTYHASHPTWFMRPCVPLSSPCPASFLQMASALCLESPFFLCAWRKVEFVTEHYLFWVRSEEKESLDLLWHCLQREAR